MRMSETGSANHAMRDGQLELALRDLAHHVTFPPTPDLARTVARRIAEEPRPGWRSTLRELWSPRLPIRRSLVLAIAALLLLVGAAIGLGLGLSGLRIVPVTSLPPTAPTTFAPGGPPGSGLGLGQLTTLDAARSAVQFTVRVPTSPGLEMPDAVYLGYPPAGGRVELVYAVREGLPPAGPTPVGLLVTQFQGDTDDGLAKKMVGGTTEIQFLTVAGGRGYYISGQPHFIAYRRPGSTDVDEEPGRLVGNVLIWESGGVIYRIESALPRDEVIRIAESMR
jgi:hypothetical protein